MYAIFNRRGIHQFPFLVFHSANSLLWPQTKLVNGHCWCNTLYSLEGNVLRPVYGNTNLNYELCYSCERQGVWILVVWCFSFIWLSKTTDPFPSSIFLFLVIFTTFSWFLFPLPSIIFSPASFPVCFPLFVIHPYSLLQSVCEWPWNLWSTIAVMFLYLCQGGKWQALQVLRVLSWPSKGWLGTLRRGDGAEVYYLFRAADLNGLRWITVGREGSRCMCSEEKRGKSISVHCFW